MWRVVQNVSSWRCSFSLLKGISKNDTDDLAGVCGDRCKGVNAVLSKAGSSVVLKSILNVPIDIDALPEGPEELAPVRIETIVPATPVKPRLGNKPDTIIIKRELQERKVFIKLEPVERPQFHIKEEPNDDL